MTRRNCIEIREIILAIFFFFFLPFTMLFDTILCYLKPILGQSNSDVVYDHKGKGDCEERRQ